MTTSYGDISPRTAAFVVAELLKRGMPLLVFEKFGQTKAIPANETKSISFRRYYLQTSFTEPSGAADFNPKEYFDTDNDPMDPADRVLTEGVTPSATELRNSDYTATLVQYGDRVVITDVVMDTHEDPVMSEAIAILGEQAAVIIEKSRFNVLKAGSNVFYANGSARTDVNTVFSLADQRKVTRFLKRNLAKPITNIVKSTPAYGTESIAASFVCVVHPDLEPDLRNIASFVPVEKYGSVAPMEGEIGKIEDCRYIMSTIIEPWDGGGAADGTDTVLETSDVSDVYPMLYFARDAYGIVPLKGKNAMTPMVVNPKPSDSDPLAQRGHVSWKGYQATIILNDFWMARLEVAVSAL
jgi:N4-gp56 family major capsid protein